jgi:hypothetical protein
VRGSDRIVRRDGGGEGERGGMWGIAGIGVVVVVVVVVAVAVAVAVGVVVHGVVVRGTVGAARRSGGDRLGAHGPGAGPSVTRRGPSWSGTDPLPDRATATVGEI